MYRLSLQALLNLTLNANWSSVALLYQDNIAAALDLHVGNYSHAQHIILACMQGLLLDHGVAVLARQVKGNDFRAILTDIKRNNAVHMLLDIEPTLLNDFFRECR